MLLRSKQLQEAVDGVGRQVRGFMSIACSCRKLKHCLSESARDLDNTRSAGLVVQEVLVQTSDVLYNSSRLVRILHRQGSSKPLPKLTSPWTIVDRTHHI